MSSSSAVRIERMREDRVNSKQESLAYDAFCGGHLMRRWMIWPVVIFTTAGIGCSQRAEQQPKLSIDLGSGVKMEFVSIPAGEFMMGSSDSDTAANLDEKPLHRVVITKPFYLGQYEVTHEQWHAVMDDNPKYDNWSPDKGRNTPVETVSWDDCQAFLAKLNEKHGNRGLNFSLPTEAQWEYAARAGSTTKWCFGDDEASLVKYAWYAWGGPNPHENTLKNGEIAKSTHPVGQKKPNAWGLYDMHGNVQEWCQDWYGGLTTGIPSDRDYYWNSPLEDPTGPVTGYKRVCRGGRWGSADRECRAASRAQYSPGVNTGTLGFRVCCSKGSQSSELGKAD